MMTAMQPNRVREPGVSDNLHVRTLTERSVSNGRFHHRDGPDSRGHLGVCAVVMLGLRHPGADPDASFWRHTATRVGEDLSGVRHR